MWQYDYLSSAAFWELRDFFLKFLMQSWAIIKMLKKFVPMVQGLNIWQYSGNSDCSVVQVSTELMSNG